MSSLLSAERKYNQKYYQYIAQLYISIILMLIFSFLFIYTLVFSKEPLTWVVFLVISVIIFTVYFESLSKKAMYNNNSWGKGSLAEEMVGTKLAALGNGYRVIHDISKGKDQENIDHVVIGPTGVFVIESKANKNVITYRKEGKIVITELCDKFMRQVARNACWTKEAINFDEFVHGIIVRPLKDNNKTDLHCSNRVCIMDGDTVYEHIKSFNGKLSEERIDEIYSKLCEIKRTNDKINRGRMQNILSMFL